MVTAFGNSRNCRNRRAGKAALGPAFPPCAAVFPDSIPYMERSTLAKWLCGILVAVVLGFLAGRQQQIADNQREILEQIQELKMQSEFKSAQVPSQPSPLEFNLSIEGSASKGDADAKLILIEFSDFECPFCGRLVY
jgi:protein-disulfide isomerase